MSLPSSRYHVTHDGCGDPQILTRTGAVYEFSPSILAVQVDGHPKVAARVKRLGCRVLQEGDREVTFLVPHADLDGIAPLIRPRVRRRLAFSAEELTRRTNRLPRRMSK